MPTGIDLAESGQRFSMFWIPRAYGDRPVEYDEPPASEKDSPCLRG